MFSVTQLRIRNGSSCPEAANRITENAMVTEQLRIRYLLVYAPVVRAVRYDGKM